MGLKKFFKKQLSIVIEWKNQNPNILFYKYPALTDEIKNASKLIVGPGQGCIVVYEGQVQDVLTAEGIYQLDTDNHPFVTTLLKIRQFFDSEHKMKIYFFRTAEIVNQGWGTGTPIKYMDNKYKFPVELGAHGNFSAKIQEPQRMFTEIIGSKDYYSTEDLRELLMSRIMPELSSFLAKSQYSYVDIDSHLSEISQAMKDRVNDIFSALGLGVQDFRIEATSFDPKTQERINTIANMTSEALAATEVGLDYVELEKLRALRDAAKNEGGLAGAGLQVGAGFELSKSLLSKKDQILESSTDDQIEQLKKLKMLLDEGIVTQSEFDEKKKEILSRI